MEAPEVFGLVYTVLSLDTNWVKSYGKTKNSPLWQGDKNVL